METEKNIVRAIAGESMARNKYTFFASKARKEGFEQISAIFIETADNEKEHAKRLMKLLKSDTESSLEKYDFPVIMGAVLLISIMLILINIIMDILYGYLDPRVRVA